MSVSHNSFEHDKDKSLGMFPIVTGSGMLSHASILGHSFRVLVCRCKRKTVQDSEDGESHDSSRPSSHLMKLITAHWQEWWWEYCLKYHFYVTLEEVGLKVSI